MTEAVKDPQQIWKEELAFRHRWGQHGEETVKRETERLQALWDAIPEDSKPSADVLAQVVGPEICNWSLKKIIGTVCEVIGSGVPDSRGTGHMATMTEERWRQVWAYYLSLRNWLQCSGAEGASVRTGYRVQLTSCDPDGETQRHVFGMLGGSSRLKTQYIERFCLLLEFWIGGFFPKDSAQMTAHAAAVKAVEKSIRKLDPDADRMLRAMDEDGGRLELCHHKVFRRYDVIISSIGAGSWRAVMPEIGTTGHARADEVDEYLTPIRNWIAGESAEGDDAAEVYDALGNPDAAKVFCASFLVSILEAQRLAAVSRAARREEQAV